MIRYLTLMGLFIAMTLSGGCDNGQQAAKPDDASSTGRNIGGFKETGSGSASQPADGTTTRPSGMPNDAIHGGLTGRNMPDDAAHAGVDVVDVEPVFSAPAEWQTRPTRTMLTAVYALPKAEGDAEDAELTVSSLPSHVSLDLNVSRWCSQFGIQGKEECEKATKRQKIDGTKFPTTVIELSGTYLVSSGPMMQRTGEQKENFKMLAAELVAPRSRWFVKVVGPEKTVEQWRAAFMKYVEEAK